MRVTLYIEAGQLHPNCHMNTYLIILNLKTSAIFSSALLEFLLAGWKEVVILIICLLTQSDAFCRYYQKKRFFSLPYDSRKYKFHMK